MALVQGLSALILILFALNGGAYAKSRITVDNEAGKKYFSTVLGYSDNRTVIPEQFYFSQWSISGGGNRSRVDDSTTGTTTTTNSRNGSLGAGFAYDKIWNFDLSGSSNSTPETNYTQSGSQLMVSYNFERENYWIKFGLGGGGGKVGQRISFKILTIFVDRDVNLDQQESDGFIAFSPVPWMSARFDLSGYAYSKSKTDLQAAFANRFLNYYTSDLVNNIGGLPEYSTSLELTFLPNSDWDISIMSQKTHLIVDDSESKKSQIFATRYFEVWSLGAGLSQVQTSQGSDTDLVTKFSIDL